MDNSRPAFPSNHIEALALEWVSRFVGSAATPETLVRQYWIAYNRISAADAEACREAKVTRPK